jgi:hypothetical protein
VRRAGVVVAPVVPRPADPGHEPGIAGRERRDRLAALCQRLDRLPLAIELAAARVGVMAPAEILTGLEARLGVLGGGSRLSPARRKTMRATVEWSYELLDATEQRAFRSLSVFVGGFDADAAMAVAPGLDVDAFARLVDKSVVVAGETPRGRTRDRLLETVREYAHELLADHGELDAIRERHLRWFSVLAERTEPDWPPFVVADVLDERREDYENIRTALEWAAEADQCAGLRLLAAMRELFPMLGQADGRRIAQLLLEELPGARPLPGRGPDHGGTPGDDDGQRPGVMGVPHRGAALERRARRARARGVRHVLPRPDADARHGGRSRACGPRGGHHAAPARR